MAGKHASQVAIFHHLPKCGGTSVLKMLADWFRLIPDYRQGAGYQPPLNLAQLTPAHCLCGHFELEGAHLAQRYPGLLENPRFWVFSFIRDPLEVKISLYRYEEKHNVGKPRTLEKHLSNRRNYLAGVLGADQDNYKTLLDKYAFIGLLEEPGLSASLLAWLLDKRGSELPWENRTTAGQARSQDTLPVPLVQQFKEENALDYAIYNYAIARFKALSETYRQEREEIDAATT